MKKRSVEEGGVWGQDPSLCGYRWRPSTDPKMAINTDQISKLQSLVAAMPADK